MVSEISPLVIDRILARYPHTPTNKLSQELEEEFGVRIPEYTIRWNYKKHSGADTFSKRKLHTHVNDKGIRMQNEMYNLTDVAKHFNMSRTKLFAGIKRLGLPIENFGHGVFITPNTYNTLEAFYKLIESRYTISSLAKTLGVPYGVLYNRYVKYGAPTIRFGDQIFIDLDKPEAEELFKSYLP